MYYWTTYKNSVLINSTGQNTVLKNNNQVRMSQSDIKHHYLCWQLADSVDIGSDLKFSELIQWPIFSFFCSQILLDIMLDVLQNLPTETYGELVCEWLTFLHKFKMGMLSGCAQNPFWCQGILRHILSGLQGTSLQMSPDGFLWSTCPPRKHWFGVNHIAAKVLVNYVVFQKLRMTRTRKVLLTFQRIPSFLQMHFDPSVIFQVVTF